MGRKISHQYLKSRLNELWKSTDNLIRIDEDWNFYIAKFFLKKNMEKVIYKGPWFILGNFLLNETLETKLCTTRINVDPLSHLVKTTKLPTKLYIEAIGSLTLPSLMV